jgi:hypothetical protein
MVAVWTTTRPELLRSSLAAAVNTVAPALPLVDVRTMEQIVGERLAPDGFNIVLYSERLRRSRERCNPDVVVRASVGQF